MSIIEQINQCIDRWSVPRKIVSNGKESSFLFASSAIIRIDKEPMVSVARIPDEVMQIYQHYEEVELFKDVECGQWGMRLLGHKKSMIATEQFIANRTKYAKHTDIVIGEFLGDQELLLCDTTKWPNVKYMIALPLDTRSDWYCLGNSLEKILVTFIQREGEKYWEVHGNN